MKNMNLDEVMKLLESDCKMRKEVERRLRKTSYRITISLPTWLADRLKKAANKTGCSMNEIIRKSLEDHVDGTHARSHTK